MHATIFELLTSGLKAFTHTSGLKALTNMQKWLESFHTDACKGTPIERSLSFFVTNAFLFSSHTPFSTGISKS